MNRIKVVHTRAILGALEREGSDFRNGSPPPLVFYVGSLNVGYPACLVSPALRFRMTTVWNNSTWIWKERSSFSRAKEMTEFSHADSRLKFWESSAPRSAVLRDLKRTSEHSMHCTH